VTRFDAQLQALVGLMDDASRVAHKPHKQQQKQTEADKRCATKTGQLQKLPTPARGIG
jgi:hypothetical protein